MVAVLNRSSAVSDADLEKMVDAWNQQMIHHVAPAWGRQPVLSHVGGRAYNHHLIVDEDKDVPGAAAYHDLDKSGHPLLVTMAGTILKGGGTMFGPDGVSGAGSHENIEAFIDPYCNDTTRGTAGRYYWHEACDATQGQDYDAPNTKIAVSNFCLPHWFNPDSPDDHVDYRRELSAPFEVSRDGYQVVSTCGDEQQIGGTSRRKAAAAKLLDANERQVDGGPNAWRTLLLTGIGQ